MILDAHAAWASLKHGGLLLAPNRLADVFPETLDPLDSRTVERLRRAVTEQQADPKKSGPLLDAVLEDLLGLGQPLRADTGSWLKASAVGSEWSRRALSGETVKPQRIWQDRFGALLPVFVDREARIGVGRGRRMPARIVEWLRASGRPLGLLTNGRQWRLIYASLDAEAFAESDTGLWFEAGEPSQQVTALRALLLRANLVPPKDDEPAPLVAAIQASRKGQGELSSILGERVRKAVELLIRSTLHEDALPNDLHTDAESCKAIYRAATRVVMRMVVVLFAESREQLLPRDNEVYQRSYGLLDLRESLQHAGAGTTAGLARLAHRHAAWPRVLSLFRVLYRGSAHEKLPIPRYGGGLFAPGDGDAPDAIDRALASFESPMCSPNDADVYRILELLCVTETRVKQGSAWKRVPIPVDFSDLSSEYIGILYEGLLDYELRRVEANDPVVFLNLGDQPALPLARLETMTDKALADLVEKLKVKKAKSEDGGEEEEQDDEGDEDEEEAEEEQEGGDTDADEEASDARRDADGRARAWALRAVEAGKLVPKARSKKKEALEKRAAEVDAKARQLIVRIVLPGEWYLVRWGGTRKGAGTFYTRPQLAVPTVRRTLEPLCFEAHKLDEGSSDSAADGDAIRPRPRAPEDLLALKVCDPAMGSGSFLVASLRYLTDALHQSLYAHGRIAAQGERTLVTLAEGKASTGALTEEALPCRPDSEDFDDRLRAILKRYVVERCLYGVDIDPLAVDLARLALWVETLDRDLPFEFLDHKLKVGNALVGCWFDRFRDYPVMAWEREGGDKNHSNGTHFEKEGWTKAIKKVRNDIVKDEMANRIVGQLDFDAHLAGESPESVHDEAVAILEEIHSGSIGDAEERERKYRELESTSHLQSLKQAFDTWCAIWFWPAERIDDVPTPKRFDRLSPEQRRVVDELRGDYRYFHWELEFPDVFRAHRGSFTGFHAILGNPPWEIQKPNSKEFFSNLDPLYRTYGKQQALGVQKEMFANAADDEREWLAYSARFKALSNWNKYVATPFGDPTEGDGFSLSRSGKENQGLHSQWRENRAGHVSYADPRHPFRHQGSADINTYKMFLEAGHALLGEGGQLGLIVPSGLYTDKGTTDLRRLFLEECRWRWLFGFENKHGIFDIHRSFKFCVVIVGKGMSHQPRASSLLTAFMRHHLDDWAAAERHAIPYERAQVERFSPRTRAILEIRDKRDLEVLEKIYANSVLLGDDGPDGWGIKYAREFDMTNDSKLFPPRPKWEERGYEPDEYGRWVKFRGKKNEERGRRLRGPDSELQARIAYEDAPEVGWIRLRNGGAVREGDIEDVALPLYEGRMIAQFDFSEKGWVSGKGRSAVWREIDWSSKAVEPQFLMAVEDYTSATDKDGNPKAIRGLKVSFMDITSATNARTMVAAVVWDVPCGNSAPVFGTVHSPVLLVGVLDSLIYDYATRARCGGLHLNYFVVDETAVPLPARVAPLEALISRICCAARIFSPHLYRAAVVRNERLSRWALTDAERLRIRCMVDAVVAEGLDLTADDVFWILRACDLPKRFQSDDQVSATLDPKGFWRVDKDKDPELRHTVLAQVAFQDLQQLIAECDGDRERAIAEFCGTGADDGWQLPETLCLADYGLGHDERAKKPQPVASRLGPRFYEWQLEQTPEESWRECEIHARNILGEEGFAKLQAEIEDAKSEREKPSEEPVPYELRDEPETALVAEPGGQYTFLPGENARAKGDESKALRRVADADYLDVFEDVGRPLAKRLFAGPGTYFFLDQAVLRRACGVDSVLSGLAILLDRLFPVHEWWHRAERDRVLTVWWSIEPALYPTSDGDDPLWLCLGNQDGNLSSRVRAVLDAVDAQLVLGVENGEPPVERAWLAEALLRDTVYRFASPDDQQMELGVIAQELAGVGGL